MFSLLLQTSRDFVSSRKERWLSTFKDAHVIIFFRLRWKKDIFFWSADSSFFYEMISVFWEQSIRLNNLAA